jgi:hypothetical protein
VSTKGKVCTAAVLSLVIAAHESVNDVPIFGVAHFFKDLIVGPVAAIDLLRLVENVRMPPNCVYIKNIREALGNNFVECVLGVLVGE